MCPQFAIDGLGRAECASFAHSVKETNVTAKLINVGVSPRKLLETSRSRGGLIPTYNPP